MSVIQYVRSESGGNTALIFFIHKLFDFRRLIRLQKNFEFRAILVLCLNNEDVGKVRICAFKNERVLGGSEVAFDGPGAVNDGKADIRQ